MLGDKMEIEAATMSKMKGELETVRKENENLRIKVQTLSETGDGKTVKDLEVFARAEKKMMVAAPGFAGPWEQAKQAAFHDLSEEDAGKATPKRFFQRFLGGSASSTAVEPVKALPASNGEQKPGRHNIRDLKRSSSPRLSQKGDVTAFNESGLSDVEVARTISRQVIGLSYFRPSSASMKSKNVWMSSR